MNLRPDRTLLRIAALLTALVTAMAAPLAGAARLTDMDVAARGSSTDVQLSLSERVAPHVFTLKHPDRLVVDLPHTRRDASLHWPAPGGAVTAVRSASRRDGSLRVVLDLAPGVRHATHTARAGNAYQLQFTLVPASASASASAVASARRPAAGASPAVKAAPATPDATPRVVVAAHAPDSGRRDIIVAVDAGHGGDDPGATGAHGTHEKMVTLAIARALAARIDQAPGMHAVLTRDGDYFITLRERIRRARAAHADMFVSIHADSVRDRAVSGASVYILSERGATNEAARLLASKENEADLKGGVSLADEGKLASVLLDLSQSANIGASVDAADDVLTALDDVGAVRKRQVLQAAFVVLKSPDIPSMLVETAYISNPAEERKLRTPQQQRRLAEAIFTGVQQYFHQHPPDGTLYASEHRPAASGPA